MKNLILFFAAFLFFAFPAFAQEEQDNDPASGEIPRMVSLRSSQVNARSGPGSRYPVEWIYEQKNAPVEIIAEFELWRQIKDWEGSTSWVHKAMLSSRRMAKITTPGEVGIYAKADYESKLIARVEDGSVGEIRKCPSNSSFCLLKFKNIEGWVAKGNFFGAYPDEVID